MVPAIVPVLPGAERTAVIAQLCHVFQDWWEAAGIWNVLISTTATSVDPCGGWDIVLATSPDSLENETMH